MQSEGGFETVVRNRDWQKVVSKLGYKAKQNLGPILLDEYEKILYPYDVFISGATTTPKVCIL